MSFPTDLEYLLICCLLISFGYVQSFEKEELYTKEVYKMQQNAQRALLAEINDQWGWHDSPRAIVAMTLSNETWFSCEDTHSQLIDKQLRLDLAGILLKRHRQTITAGQLALYINALICLCHDPQNFYELNLISKMKHIPVTSGYELALSSLTLCISGHHLSTKRMKDLNNLLQTRSDGSEYEIDTQALAIMALSCTIETSESYTSSLLYEPLKNLKKMQKTDGSFGNNIYTTALVVQALLSAHDNGRGWKFERALKYLKLQYDNSGSVLDVVAYYFILPVLSGKSLVNLRKRDCNCYHDNIDTVQHSKKTSGSYSPQFNYNFETNYDVASDFAAAAENFTENEIITVIYSVWINDLEDPDFQNLNLTLTVNISDGETFLNVMKKAASMDRRLWFTLKNHTLGSYVQSLSGLNNDVSQKTFWMIYKVDQLNQELKLSDKGISHIRPKDQDHYVLLYKSVP